MEKYSGRGVGREQEVRSEVDDPFKEIHAASPRNLDAQYFLLTRGWAKRQNAK